MLMRCCCLWTLLVTLPVLIHTQKYYMSFIFNNNGYVRSKPPSLNNSNSMSKSDIQTDIGNSNNAEATEHKHEEEKISMRAPMVTNKKERLKNSVETSDESQKSDKSGERDHAHSFSHEHSDSHEVIHRSEMPSRERLGHYVHMSPSLEQNLNDYDTGLNTDENDLEIIDADIETELKKIPRSPKNETGNNDIAIAITNNTIIDELDLNHKSQMYNDVPVKTKPEPIRHLPNMIDGPIVVDNINFEDIFKEKLRINNIVCKRDTNVKEVFGLTLSADYELKFKFLCIVQGYKDSWLLVLRESFPSYRYFPDFSHGFAPKDYLDVAISMEALSYITTNRNIQLLLIARNNDNQVIYAKYGHFVVGDVHEDFTLKSLGHYEGNATDWLNYFLNNKFSDYLKIYVEKFDCEIMKLGGWWAHNTTHCTFPEDRNTELNGSLEMYIQEAPVNNDIATITTIKPTTETPTITIS